MRRVEGYKRFLRSIKKKLFEYRFDRASPDKKKGITFDEAEHLIKVFLLNRNVELTVKQAEKEAKDKIELLKEIIKKLEHSPSHKYLPILRKKRKSARRTIKRQSSLQARKPRHHDEKRYYMTRFKRKKNTKKTKRSLHHSLSPSEKWGTV